MPAPQIYGKKEEEAVIVRQLPLGQLQTNCYLLGCERTRQGVVIDPGDEAARIIGEIEALSLEVLFVLNTHAHFDHIGANAEVVAETGARLAIHALDLPLLHEAGGAAYFGIDIPASPEPSLLLEEGTSIVFGDHTLRTLFTPGHTPGHVSFYEKSESMLFDGDVLFAGGIGRTDLPGGDHARLMESIEKKLMTLPDATRVYSGHGPATTIRGERPVLSEYL